MSLLVATQFRGRDLAGFDDALKIVSAELAPDDTLLSGQKWMYSSAGTELKLPLTFYYRHKVVSTDSDNNALFIDYFCSQKEQVFYLGDEKTQGLGRPHRRISNNFEVFEQAPHAPLDIVRATARYHLFRIDCRRWKRYRNGLQE